MILKGKVALVTGGTSGIGLAIAEIFLKEGAKVVISGRTKQKCERIMKPLEKIAKGRVAYAYGNVADAKEAKGLVDATVKKFGRIDILVNSAGIYLEKRAEKTTEEEWDMVMDIDLKGVFLCSKAAYPYFKRQKCGNIINVSSDAGIFGNPNCAAYCAAKGGVTNLTRAMALDYAKENIRVNAVCPAVIDTPMLEKEACIQQDPALYLKNAAEEHPVGRYGKAEEVAWAVLMLAADQAAFITGANLPIDGGLTAR